MTTGLKGEPTEKIIERFWGDLKRWPIEPDGINISQAQILEIATHIHTTGDCLWHATAVLQNRLATCHCANCQPVSGKVV